MAIIGAAASGAAQRGRAAHENTACKCGSRFAKSLPVGRVQSRRGALSSPRRLTSMPSMCPVQPSSQRQQQQEQQQRQKDAESAANAQANATAAAAAFLEQQQQLLQHAEARVRREQQQQQQAWDAAARQQQQAQEREQRRQQGWPSYDDAQQHANGMSTNGMSTNGHANGTAPSLAQQQQHRLEAELRHLQLGQQQRAAQQQQQQAAAAAAGLPQRPGGMSWASAAAAAPSLAALSARPQTVAGNLAAIGSAATTSSNPGSDEWQMASGMRGRSMRHPGDSSAGGAGSSVSSGSPAPVSRSRWGGAAPVYADLLPCVVAWEACSGHFWRASWLGGARRVATPRPALCTPPRLLSSGRHSDDRACRPGGQDSASADPTTKLWMGGIDGSASADTVRGVFGRWGGSRGAGGLGSRARGRLATPRAVLGRWAAAECNAGSWAGAAWPGLWFGLPDGACKGGAGGGGPKRSPTSRNHRLRTDYSRPASISANAGSSPCPSCLPCPPCPPAGLAPSTIMSCSRPRMRRAAPTRWVHPWHTP